MDNKEHLKKIEKETYKIKIPLKLYNYTIISQHNTNLTKKDTNKDLHNIAQFLYDEEKHYLHSQKYKTLTTNIIKGKTELKGNANQWGRNKGVNTTKPYDYQPYNVSEMFRTNVINKTYGYVQNAALHNLYKTYGNNIPEDLKQIKQDFKQQYPHIKTPTDTQLATHDYRVREKGVTKPTKPKESKTLPLWATDGHHTKINYNLQEKYIVLHVKLKSFNSMVSLRFDIPDTDDNRFLENVVKITKPTITFDDKQEPVFHFSIVKEVEKVETVNYFGVDLGKVELFVGTVLYPDEKKYSAPFFTDKKINRLSEKLDRKYDLAENLKRKSDVCLASNKLGKSEVLSVERERVLASASRLKGEISVRLACLIVDIAVSHDACIVFEDLRWLGSRGGKWNFRDVQSRTEHLAMSRGIGVVYKGAGYSSRECSDCNSRNTSFRDRVLVCSKCGKRLNRDVSASRSMGKRGVGVKVLKNYKQLSNKYSSFNNILSVHTLVSSPVTCFNSPGLMLLQGGKTINNFEVFNTSKLLQ